MPRVIVLDTLAPEGLELLAAAPGIEYEVRTGLKGDALREALAQFDGAICRSGVKITAEALEGNRRLKAIVRAGVGTDNIDKDAATRLGHRRDEHAGRQHAQHGRAHDRADAGAVAEYRPGLPEPARRASGIATSTWARRSPARRWASSAWGASAWPWPSGHGRSR